MIGIGLDHDKPGNPAEAREWFNKALEVHADIVSFLSKTGLALNNPTHYQDPAAWLDSLLLTDVTD
jgi:hypothetical protein